MEYLPLLTIPALYFAVALIKPSLALRWNVCAMCAAVSATWLALLAMWFFGVPMNTLPIGILMGMSVSGLMYRMEPVYARRKIKNFWLVRLVLILGGFTGTFLLLTGRHDAFIPVAVTSVIAIVSATLLFQGTTHADAVRTGEREGKSRSLLKKLDNCC